MGYRHKYIEFRISRRMLWVGAQAYPLHNIARVRSEGYVPDRRAAVWGFVKKAARWTGFGLLGLLGLACIGESAPVGAYVVLALVVFGVLTWHTVRLVRALAEPNLYALFIETAAPHMALVTTNEPLIQELIQRVAEAIDNPAMEYAKQVDIILGDKHIGDKFGGDHVRGNKIEHQHG